LGLVLDPGSYSLYPTPMRIDGKAISARIKEELKTLREGMGESPRVLLVYAGSDPVIDSYIKIKERTAREVGVELEVVRFEEDVSEEEIVKAIKDSKHDGIVVQLPLPSHLSIARVVNEVSVEKDIDVLSEKAFTLFESGESSTLPPVAGAIDEVIRSVEYDVHDKRIAIVGKGKLVGVPVLSLLRREGIEPRVFEEGDDLGELKDYDLVISGVGKPWIIKPQFVKEGAFLIDAGTSVEGGVSKGDIDPVCEARAAYYSGVPGGIGPVTVAILFRNLFGLLPDSRFAKNE
jgi:methylenetetrahydrofolate dehydrogenase (NADP+) / methenyltetrahydrofolate cyclohydrolase